MVAFSCTFYVLFQASMVEIYNETIQDLLSDTGETVWI